MYAFHVDDDRRNDVERNRYDLLTTVENALAWYALERAGMQLGA